MTDTERRALLLISDLSRSVGFLIGAMSALSPNMMPSDVLAAAQEQAREDVRKVVKLICELMEEKA